MTTLLLAGPGSYPQKMIDIYTVIKWTRLFFFWLLAYVRFQFHHLGRWFTATSSCLKQTSRTGRCRVRQSMQSSWESKGELDLLACFGVGSTILIFFDLLRLILKLTYDMGRTKHFRCWIHVARHPIPASHHCCQPESPKPTWSILGTFLIDRPTVMASAGTGSSEPLASGCLNGWRLNISQDPKCPVAWWKIRLFCDIFELPCSN